MFILCHAHVFPVMEVKGYCCKVVARLYFWPVCLDLAELMFGFRARVLKRHVKVLAWARPRFLVRSQV